jgi:LEA14-like dessication related protein
MQILKEPSVTFESVKIHALHLTSIDLVVVLRIMNPNPISVTVRDLPFTIFFHTGDHEEEIAKGNAGKMVISAKASTAISVPVTSFNLALIGALATFVGKGSLKIEIRGSVVIDHLLGWTIPFCKTVDVTVGELAEAIKGKMEEKKDTT